jgi:isopentenyl phosphate kinase
MQGVNWVSRARRAMILRSAFHVGDENVGALNHLHGAGGVAHVAAGQAEMEPAAGGPLIFSATAVVKAMTS